LSLAGTKQRVISRYALLACSIEQDCATDIGIDDNFMKAAAGALAPRQAALCVLVRKVTADKVLPAMAAFGGKVLHTNL